MDIRDARISDAREIHRLVNYYAELDKMLFRSLANVYENLLSFKVAEVEGKIIGCCGLEVVWSDLAEIKSLAIEQTFSGKGVGKALVMAACDKARKIGINRIFALTLEPEFFSKLGFKRVDRKVLPMKVWSDCARCPKQDKCDEVAVIIEMGELVE
jgi:amino-acid N-acetyltransferase